MMGVATYPLHFAQATFLGHTAKTGMKMIVVEAYVRVIPTPHSVIARAQRINLLLW